MRRRVARPPHTPGPRAGPHLEKDECAHTFLSTLIFSDLMPRPAPGRRASNKEATRQRIVAAALALFQSKGFEPTTTRAIARKAKVAEGTVFNYFETKEDIALYFLELEVS